MSPIISILANASAYGYRSLSAAAAGPSFESIASATPTGDSVTFSSISGTYASLQIRASFLNVSSGSDFYIRFNGDTTSSYNWHQFAGNGGSVSTTPSSDNTIRIIYNADTSSSLPTGAIIDVHNYASTTQNKTVRIFAGQDRNGSGIVSLTSGLWRNTAAVTSVTIYSPGVDFNTGRQISLYGIKG